MNRNSSKPLQCYLFGNTRVANTVWAFMEYLFKLLMTTGETGHSTTVGVAAVKLNQPCMDRSICLHSACELVVVEQPLHE